MRVKFTDEQRVEGNKKSTRKYYIKNREKIVQAQKDRRIKFPEVQKETQDRSRVRKYGITLEEYQERMSSSDSCQMCGKTEKDGVLLCYDHDHTSNEFRGILCSPCNSGLGLIGDYLENVEHAVNYLKGVKNEFKTITR